MPITIPAFPSPAYDVATNQVTSTGRAPEAEKSDAAPDHADEFAELFLAALMVTNAAIDESPAGPDRGDTSLTSSVLEPAEDSPVDEESTLDTPTLSQGIPSRKIPANASMDDTSEMSINDEERNDGFDGTGKEKADAATADGDRPLYPGDVAEASVISVAANAVVEPSQSNEPRFAIDAQDHVARQNRFGRELFASPTPPSELLDDRSDLPLPNQQKVTNGSDMPEGHSATETPVSGTPAPSLVAPESRSPSPGRIGLAAIRKELVADEPALHSELDVSDFEQPAGLDRSSPNDLARTSLENGPSELSGFAADAAFNARTGATIEAADLTPRAADRAGPQVHRSELPVADGIFGMPLAAEDVGGHVAAFSDSPAAHGTPAPIARQLATAFISHAELSTKDKETQFEMRLEPPELGRVTVHLRHSDAGLKAHIVVGREATVPILERELPVLQAMLENAGVTVENFDVSHDHGDGLFQDDRDYRDPFDDDDDKTRTFRAVARLTAGIGWIGAGRVDLQA